MQVPNFTEDFILEKSLFYVNLVQKTNLLESNIISSFKTQ